MRALWLLLLLAACATPSPPEARPPEPQRMLRSELGPMGRSTDGSLRWPPDDGFRGPAPPISLPPGVLLDRFGDDRGNFLSPKGAGFNARALPYVCQNERYSAFRVVTPLPVWIGRASAWFNVPGGATQVQTDASVQQLLDDGVLVRVQGASAPCK